MKYKYDLAVVMPCLNEEKTLEVCIQKAWKGIKSTGVSGIVVVADNGSTDRSIAIAKKNKAMVVNVKDKGYGSALRGGIEAAEAKYIIMGDSDDSHDLETLSPFIEKLHNGFDLVVGNRFKGGIDKETMKFLHRYLGNPLLSFIARIFFRNKVGDYHCGMRGFSKDAYFKMNVQTTGMEFASEMIVKASLNRLKITEVPTKVKKDGRDRAPHLNTWRDGWRHLKFLLAFAPRWLYLIPGLIMFLPGVIVFVISFFNIPILKQYWGLHTVIFSSFFIIGGFQFLSFYHLTTLFKHNISLYKGIEKTFLLKTFSVNNGILIGALLALFGLAIFFTEAIYFFGLSSNIKVLSIGVTMRFAILGLCVFAIGIQLLMNAFFAEILNIKTKK